MSVINISAPVGIKAKNRYNDVMKVQVMLNHFRGLGKLTGGSPLVLDGDYGSKTGEAIMMFQFQNGLISEEHFNGQIRPGGMTIKFMNNQSSYMPPKPPKPSQLSKEEQQARVLEELKQLRFDGKISEREYQWAAGTARNVLAKADQGITHLNLAMDLADLATILPATHSATGVTAFGYVAGGMAIAGPILQFIGFVLSLNDAMNTHFRIYRSVATAYTVTAWAFEEKTPRQSDLVRNRILDPSGYFYGTPPSKAELDDQWQGAVTATETKMNKLGSKAGDAKDTLRITLQADGKKNLAIACVLSIAAALPNKRVRESDSLRDIARNLSYPG